MFDRLGRLVLRLRFVLVAGWAVAALGFGILGPSLASVGSADETSFLPRDAESLAARQIIAQSFPSTAAPSVALIVFSGRAASPTPTGPPSRVYDPGSRAAAIPAGSCAT